MRRVPSAAIALLLAAAPTACADDDGAAPDAPASTPDGRPPGTAITAELSTPPGTVLLGSPFAYTTAAGGPVSGVEALLLVTGDPVEAFTDLYDQAEQAGVELLAFHPDEDEEPAFCQVADVTYPEAAGDRWPLDADDLPDGPLSLECAAHGFGERTRLDLQLIVSERDEPHLSFIRITEDHNSESSPLPDMEAPAARPEGPSPVSPPDFPGSLPGAGDQIGEPFAPDGEHYRLLDGFELLAPPIMSTCATGGFVAVVRSDDDLDTAVEAYAEHLAETAFAQVPPPDADTTTEYDGATMRRVTYSGAGAGDASVTGVAADGEPTYLLLERCND